ncbi:MAG TPA: alpha-ketoglutarate-dependent dioxygenase AlkB [Vicinamibacterales bacterium]|nr:alpha-ketoglutarate-dependent dioxygenase AlkB [Vicinamibacterales bacterium]
MPDYVDQDTHDALMASVDLHPWLWSVDHAVQIYGYRYHHPSQSVLRIGELPAWSLDLVRRLCRDGFFRSMPDQMVVNDYQPGAGFFAHIDQAVFGDQVASLSLGSTCVMEFSKGAAEGTGQILLEPRSLLLLSGEARREWLHGIPARNSDIWQQREWPRTRRVSLTFRSIPTIAEQTQQQ